MYSSMSTITLGGSGDVASLGREGIKLLLIREILTEMLNSNGKLIIQLILHLLDSF